MKNADNDADKACRCWIRHAISPEYREKISKELGHAREMGDNVGVIVALAQLSPCPSSTTN